MAMMAPEEGCGGECTGQPNGTPCSDEGNPSCSVGRCQSGACAHRDVPPLNPDPYPAGNYPWDTPGLTPGTAAALTCLEDLVRDAGGGVVARASAWRPEEYQAHLYEIYWKSDALKDWPEAECAETKAAVDSQKQSHGLNGVVGQNSNHVLGTAFDVTVTVPVGTTSTPTLESAATWSGTMPEQPGTGTTSEAERPCAGHSLPSSCLARWTWRVSCSGRCWMRLSRLRQPVGALAKCG